MNQIIHNPALLYTMVLAGEEIPDLLQKRAAEHPDTDPFVREVNRYHRQEEARHLSFARTRLPEVWETAGIVDKTFVRFVAPLFIREMYENMIHAGVFAAAGLPGMATWQKARNHPGRVQTRVDATRPVLEVLIGAGAAGAGQDPPGLARPVRRRPRRPPHRLRVELAADRSPHQRSGRSPARMAPARPQPFAASAAGRIARSPRPTRGHRERPRGRSPHQRPGESPARHSPRVGIWRATSAVPARPLN